MSEWMSKERWRENDAIIVGLKKDFCNEVIKLAKKEQQDESLQKMIRLGRRYLQQAPPATPPKNNKEPNLYDMYSPEKEEEPVATNDGTNTMVRNATATSTAETDDPFQYYEASIRDECASYFADMAMDMMVEDMTSFNLMDYWRAKKDASKYSSVRLCARKWLAVPAMSTPSERVWSICGLIDAPKRNKIDDRKLEAQAMVHNNYHAMHAYHVDIKKRTCKAMVKRCAKRSRTTDDK
jgi:hypothetical protein